MNLKFILIFFLLLWLRANPAADRLEQEVDGAVKVQPWRVGVSRVRGPS